MTFPVGIKGDRRTEELSRVGVEAASRRSVVFQRYNVRLVTLRVETPEVHWQSGTVSRIWSIGRLWCRPRARFRCLPARSVMRSRIFRDMRSAPLDGTAVEVRHGPLQMIVSARWSSQNQAWIRTDDPSRLSLHRVAGWRPVNVPARTKR